MDLDLPAASLVLVDSAPFIYATESPESLRGRTVAAFLEAAEASGLRLAVSAIAWIELLELPLARNDRELASRYRRRLADSSRFLVAGVDVAIAEEAARLRSVSRGLELADSLHIATARVLGAAAILGNDEAWRRVPGCPRLILVDELAFDLDA